MHIANPRRLERKDAGGLSLAAEVKKEVDRTWGQISDIIKTGVSAANIEKIKSLVQEKVEKVKELGDKAFEKGLEQAKPYLDKNPQVKKLIEENKDALKTGNVQDVWWNVENLGTLAFTTAELYAQCKIQPTAGTSYDVPGLGSFKVGDKGTVLLGEPTIVTPENVKNFPF